MRLRKYISFVLLVAALMIGGLSWRKNILRQYNGQIYDVVQDSVFEEKARQEEPSEEEIIKSSYHSPIDFESLWKINQDVYAWIEIPDTEVSYPILQHPNDPNFYLDHTIEGACGLPGSIYTETGTSQNWDDYFTVIYGHNMKNGSMFGELKKYRNEEYLAEHPYIRVYAPEAEYLYQIFAAVVYDDRLLTSAFDPHSQAGLQDYLNSLLEIRDLNSYILSEISVTSNDCVLTLSTCISGEPEKRYLLEAVLVDEKQ